MLVGPSGNPLSPTGDTSRPGSRPSLQSIRVQCDIAMQGGRKARVRGVDAGRWTLTLAGLSHCHCHCHSDRHCHPPSLQSSLLHGHVKHTRTHMIGMLRVHTSARTPMRGHDRSCSHTCAAAYAPSGTPRRDGHWTLDVRVAFAQPIHQGLHMCVCTYVCVHVCACT